MGHGKNISTVEVTNISAFGIWVYVHDKEYFLPYAEFPCFKEARISDTLNIQALSPTHLSWPTLDVDVHLQSLMYPDQFPLTAKQTVSQS